MRRFNAIGWGTLALVVAMTVIGITFAVRAASDERPRLAAPSPTAGVPAPHAFFAESVPPPMPAPVVGKRTGSLIGKQGGSLAPAKVAGGPVAKEAGR